MVHGFGWMVFGATFGFIFLFCSIAFIVCRWRANKKALSELAKAVEMYKSLSSAGGSDESLSPTTNPDIKFPGEGINSALLASDRIPALAVSSTTDAMVAGALPYGRPPPASPRPGAPATSGEPESHDMRRRRIEWIKYYVETDQLEDAFDLGWTGVDWRSASGSTSDAANALPEAGAAVPGAQAPASPPWGRVPRLAGSSGHAAFGEDPDEEERRLGWIKHYVANGQLDKAHDLGWDGLDWRGGDGGGEGGGGASSQFADESAEEEERRHAWIKHYVEIGELAKARDLGYNDGIDTLDGTIDISELLLGLPPSSTAASPEPFLESGELSPPAGPSPEPNRPPGGPSDPAESAVAVEATIAAALAGLHGGRDSPLSRSESLSLAPHPDRISHLPPPPTFDESGRQSSRR